LLVAAPIPASLLRRLGVTELHHLTPFAALDSIVQRVFSRGGDWAECEVALRATPGWNAESAKRWFRDYSVLDFELQRSARGSYCYFFAGEPGRWALLKNLSLPPWRDAEQAGFGTVRVTLDSLLARYAGPLFGRLDDGVVVIRGDYVGPALVRPLPVRFSTPR
jgi:hypothetical protein